MKPGVPINVVGAYDEDMIRKPKSHNNINQYN